MTEEKWATTTGIAGMLAVPGVPGVRGAERKLRLFAVACCRQNPPWCELPHVRETLSAAEGLADGTLTRSAVAARQTALGLRYNQLLNTAAKRGEAAAINAEATCLSACMFALNLDGPDAARCAADLLRASHDFGAATRARWRKLFPRLLRDIFGNPFCPFTFSPAWRTDTAVSLAQQLYESREFGAMPILADALQDAGCDSDDILNHCRDTSATHVRGCWVVDLVRSVD